jgi:hypothetical protein
MRPGVRMSAAGHDGSAACAPLLQVGGMSAPMGTVKVNAGGPELRQLIVAGS